MARQTVASWFEAHSPALLTLNLIRQDGKSWRQCVKHLRTACDYPFSDHTALMDFGQVEGVLTPRPKPREAPRHPAPIPTFERSAYDIAQLAKAETFFVTSAVNNCPGVPGFLQTLERWRHETGGIVVCNPVQYQNRKPADPNAKPDKDVWWEPELQEFMIQQEIRPHPHLSLMTTKAAGTSPNPVPQRMDGLTKDRSAVFGHPQLTMRTVAAPHLNLPKILYSSGAATEPIYSDTVAGDMAKHHHTIGGVIVEVRGDRFHLREVNWDGECFIDVDRKFTPDGHEAAPRALALVPGDIHVGLEDPLVMEAVFAQDGKSLCEVIRPIDIMLHDLFNATACGQHDNSPFDRAMRWQAGTSNIVQELQSVGEWVDQWLPPYSNGKVVYSNHDDMLKRWAYRNEKDVEPENLPFYYRLKANILDEHAETLESVNVFELAMRMVCPEAAALLEFLGPNASHRLMNVELALHGHKASNGVRGGAAALARLATRLIAGHVHAPVIWQGVYLAGLSSIYRHGYNDGPSGWLQTMVALLANGRRQMYHVVDGKYRG